MVKIMRCHCTIAIDESLPAKILKNVFNKFVFYLNALITSIILVSFRIQSFQRKSDAVSVCLVFEAAGVEDYQGAGYHHPQESVPAPKGLDSYPAIFSYPNVSKLVLLSYQ